MNLDIPDVAGVSWHIGVQLRCRRGAGAGRTLEGACSAAGAAWQGCGGVRGKATVSSQSRTLSRMAFPQEPESGTNWGRRLRLDATGGGERWPYPHSRRLRAQLTGNRGIGNITGQPGCSASHCRRPAVGGRAELLPPRPAGSLPAHRRPVQRQHHRLGPDRDPLPRLAGTPTV